MLLVLLGALVGATLLCAFALLSIGGTLLQLLGYLRRPPLQPGDILVVRSFGAEQRCFVVDVGTDGTVLIAPAPDPAQ